MEGEEYEDSWRHLPSTPRAHQPHPARGRCAHGEFRQGVTQAVTEIHTGEDTHVYKGTRRLHGQAALELVLEECNLCWGAEEGKRLAEQTGPAT